MWFPISFLLLSLQFVYSSKNIFSFLPIDNQVFGVSFIQSLWLKLCDIDVLVYSLILDAFVIILLPLSCVPCHFLCLVIFYYECIVYLVVVVGMQMGCNWVNQWLTQATHHYIFWVLGYPDFVSTFLWVDPKHQKTPRTCARLCCLANAVLCCRSNRSDDMLLGLYISRKNL